VSTAATQKLPTEYDRSSQGLKLFLNQLRDRAKLYGWDDILTIPNAICPGPDQQVYLITHAGNLDLVQVRAHAATYARGPSKASQDTAQLYACIMGSLSSDAQSTVAIRVADDSFNDPKHVSGTCLLKVVTMDASNATNAAVRHIREESSDLVAYKVSVDRDIGVLNRYVKRKVTALATSPKKPAVASSRST
jgi:hypothetical protein